MFWVHTPITLELKLRLFIVLCTSLASVHVILTFYTCLIRSGSFHSTMRIPFLVTFISVIALYTPMVLGRRPEIFTLKVLYAISF